ncbi:MAG TPA: M23 family metallopeptidase [Natronosporangium sp.]|nr:M23 family metallopeptidase [Natronosporangium sp.]
MLNKFIRKYPRVSRWFSAERLHAPRRFSAEQFSRLHRWFSARRFPRIPRGQPGLAHFNVIRHRARLGLAGQGQRFAAAGAAALVIMAALLANVAEQRSDEGGGAYSAYEETSDPLADREAAADRADRADRGGEGKAKAAEPEESPKPDKKKKKKKRKADWVHPMPNSTTTSCYGMRWGKLHAGVDLAAPHGTKIRAVGAGTVVNAGWVFSGYGISVVIDHGNGYLTHYAHASEAKVSVGEKVKPGDVIALEGSTGNSTGPHLHFEVHDGMWNQIEPVSWLRDRGVKIGGC